MNFYVGKTAVKFNIPEAAVNRLKDLIREHNKSLNPMSQGTA
jgi:(E)-4-hydroxy-3-methylbut-2-enyl-diphosphate synthase